MSVSHLISFEGLQMSSLAHTYWIWHDHSIVKYLGNISWHSGIAVCMPSNMLSIHFQIVPINTVAKAYAGLRGAMAFALALQSVHDLPDGHGEIIFTATTFIVVLTVSCWMNSFPNIIYHCEWRVSVCKGFWRYAVWFCNSKASEGLNWNARFFFTIIWTNWVDFSVIPLKSMCFKQSLTNSTW